MRWPTAMLVAAVSQAYVLVAVRGVGPASDRPASRLHLPITSSSYPFVSPDAQRQLDLWRCDYNAVRPHSLHLRPRIEQPRQEHRRRGSTRHCVFGRIDWGVRMRIDDSWQSFDAWVGKAA